MENLALAVNINHFKTSFTLKSVAKMNRYQQYSDEHDRLANLFGMDRVAFEIERKRILNEAIVCLPNSEKRMAEQKDLDIILKRLELTENQLL